MTRRTHVVRSEDPAGPASPRALGGCTILCTTVNCGNVTSGDSFGRLEVDVTSDFQRTYVAATVSDITFTVEEPDRPGSWDVTFWKEGPAHDGSATGEYWPPLGQGSVYLDTVVWHDLLPPINSGYSNRLEQLVNGDWVTLYEMPGAAQGNVGVALTVEGPIRFWWWSSTEDWEVMIRLSSPEVGGDMSDAWIPPKPDT